MIVLDDMILADNPARVSDAPQWLQRMRLPEREFTRGGGWWTREGVLVTWDGSDNPRTVSMQTWPGGLR